MPRFNGTGPMGNGPKTGRGMGNCTRANDCPRFGFRNFFSRTNQVNSLQQEEKILEEELKAVKEAIKNDKDQK